MADLEKHEDRESWIRWAREFVRRGLWPVEIITVHGPHSPPSDCHWGKQTFPLLKRSEFSRHARQWLKIAKRMLNTYEEEWKQAAKKFQTERR